MSRTVKGNKGCGYEYDNRRHKNGWKIGVGRQAKQLTSRVERRKQKQRCLEVAK